MKADIKAFFNEVFIIIISFLLFFIGILYSDDTGFYSRELLSNGSEDFGFFIGMTKLNIFGIIFGSINVIVNIILLKLKNKIVNVSYIIYMTIFIMQLLVLFLLNLDTDLVHVFFTFDLFSLWFSIYIYGTFILILFTKLIRNSNVSFEYIKLKIIHKIIIIIGFIVFLALLWFFWWRVVSVFKSNL
jgi:hypothetical protein